jgi:hypothetical protein
MIAAEKMKGISKRFIRDVVVAIKPEPMARPPIHDICRKPPAKCRLTASTLQNKLVDA